LPFAKRGERASCGNAQHLPCQPSRMVIRSRLSHRITHCLFLRAIRPVFSPGFSRRDYLPPIGKRNPTPFSRDVLLSTIDNYIMLLCSAAQHQRVAQARQRKAWQRTAHRTT
jgi:hypothetical protein